MQIGAITSANQVWTAATRTLSSEAGTKAGLGAVNSPLGAGVTLDLRPAAGVFREITAIIVTGSSTTVQFYDGSTLVIPASEINPVTWASGSAVGMAIKNSSAGAVNISYCGFDMA